MYCPHVCYVRKSGFSHIVHLRSSEGVGLRCILSSKSIEDVPFERICSLHKYYVPFRMLFDDIFDFRVCRKLFAKLAHPWSVSTISKYHPQMPFIFRAKVGVLYFMEIIVAILFYFCIHSYISLCKSSSMRG